MDWCDRAQAGAEDARLTVRAGVELQSSSQPRKKQSLPASLELALPVFVALLVLQGKFPQDHFTGGSEGFVYVFVFVMAGRSM